MYFSGAISIKLFYPLLRWFADVQACPKDLKALYSSNENIVMYDAVMIESVLYLARDCFVHRTVEVIWMDRMILKAELASLIVYICI